MTATRAILAGSFIIASAIIASAAIFLPAEGAKDISAARVAESARYQIVKVDETRAWRLDTASGRITLCRLSGDNLICAESAQATRFPPKSPDQIVAERRTEAARSAEERARQEAAAEERRKDRIAERNHIFDRFFALFERIIRLAEKHPERLEPTTVQPDDT